MPNKSYYHLIKNSGRCVGCNSMRKRFNNTLLCYKCWAEKCWRSMLQRTRKRKTYKGVNVIFSKDNFVLWALTNKPAGIIDPTIDRIDPKGDYTFGNIRWLSRAENAYRKTQDGVPEGMLKCTICNNIYPATTDYFYKKEPKYGNGKYNVRNPCKKCRIKENNKRRTK